MSTSSCSHPALYAARHHENERRTRWVVILTALVMLAEIAGGKLSGSMALLADGFHMATHVGALGITLLAYAYARRHANDRSYSFGTGKVGDLAGFTSALLLGAIALYVVGESIQRLINPVNVAYGEAISIATLGLIVNAASAMILQGAGHEHHPHDHDDAHVHEHDHHNHARHNHAHHHDHNYRSAYIHVLADAVTSVLAIFALGCGWKLGWRFMDPLTGIVGAGVILSWTWSLLQQTAGTLLDRTPKTPMAGQIEQRLREQGAGIIDLHLWRIGPGCDAAVITITTTRPTTAAQVREWLKHLPLAHLTVEINQPYPLMDRLKPDFSPR